MATDCSKHAKEVAGISDMKVLAELIGDLHYETLAELLENISIKLNRDARKDAQNSRINLSIKLMTAADFIERGCAKIYDAWRISKPFMEDKK